MIERKKAETIAGAPLGTQGKTNAKDRKHSDHGYVRRRPVMEVKNSLRSCHQRLVDISRLQRNRNQGFAKFALKGHIAIMYHQTFVLHKAVLSLPARTTLYFDKPSSRASVKGSAHLCKEDQEGKVYDTSCSARSSYCEDLPLPNAERVLQSAADGCNGC